MLPCYKITNFTAVVLFVLTALCLQSATAQSQTTPVQANQNVERNLELQISQLDNLVKSLNEKLAARDRVRSAIAAAASDDIPDLQLALGEINEDIRETRQVIEQISVGSVDLGLFEEAETDLNWQTELTQVTLPLIQNLKRITEKPRKIEAARTKIELASEQQRNAELAAANIASIMEKISASPTYETLQELKQSWTEKAQEFDREINLATVQLSNLQRSDTPIWVTVTAAIVSFFKGRGLTLLLAAAFAFLVYYVAAFLARFITRRKKGENKSRYRTRERIIHYGLQAFRALLILITVMMVFYLRGDILLLAISILFTAGLILSLRHTLPKFLDELQVLLNLGAVREEERVMYQGLPWKVSQLNMYSILTNPEITGVMRVPMHEMQQLSSRPAGKEPWFPASRNDYVLLDDGRFLQVIKITPEHVLLMSLAGTQTMITTAAFFSMVFQNLSRSPSYFVSSQFGIGYAHQKESVSNIPAKLKSALEAELATYPEIAHHVDGVYVELKEAGASSLDYWLGVQMKSEAVTSYYKIMRLMQQVCVKTCTEENWDIPFPQLTLHNA